MKNLIEYVKNERERKQWLEPNLILTLIFCNINICRIFIIKNSEIFNIK